MKKSLTKKRGFAVGAIVVLMAAMFVLVGCGPSNDPGPAVEALAAPANFAASASDGQVTLTWSSFPNSNAGIIRFEVGYGSGGNFTETRTVERVGPVLMSMIMITGLTNDVEYSFRVRGVTAGGNGAWSDTVTATPEAWTVAPGMPASIDIDTMRTRSVPGNVNLVLTWPNVPGATFYEVRVGTANDVNTAWTFTADGSSQLAALEVNINNINGVDLEPNTTHYFWVRAGNAIGTSDWRAGSGDTAPMAIAAGLTTVRGVPVWTFIYIEVNDTDPRVVLGYQLEDGTQLFQDVIIFAANIRYADCNNPNENVALGGYRGHCTRSGLHLCFNGNVQHVLDNRDIFISPLQERGITVRLGLLPHWSGVTFGTMGYWPFEITAPVSGPGHPSTYIGTASNAALANHPARGMPPPATWPVNAQGIRQYRFDHATRDALILEIAQVIEQFGLDGVDIDDEWSSAGHGEFQMATPNIAFWWGEGGVGGVGGWNYFFAGSGARPALRVANRHPVPPGMTREQALASPYHMWWDGEAKGIVVQDNPWQRTYAPNPNYDPSDPECNEPEFLFVDYVRWTAAQQGTWTHNAGAAAFPAVGTNAYRAIRMGARQAAEFALEMRRQLDGVQERTGRRQFITWYEYGNNMRRLPAQIWCRHRNEYFRTIDFIDGFTQPFYGSWMADSWSAATAGVPRTQFSPMAIDLGHGASTVRPSWDAVVTQANQFLQGGYGLLFMYGLYARNRFEPGPYIGHPLNMAPHMNRATYPLYFGAAGRMPEDYLSRFTEVVFGQRTIFVGSDFPQPWPQYTRRN